MFERSDPIKEISETISDRFRIEEQIATGGMGSVYRAYDTVLKRSVALKVLKMLGWTPQQAIRFQNEAKVTSNLNHPNIATVYDFGISESGSPYLVLEYIEG